MKKNYAYLDKGGILHISKSYDTARTYSANGTMIETDVEALNGYPVAAGKTVIVYGPDDMKITADGDKIEPVPALIELYNKCK